MPCRLTLFARLKGAGSAGWMLGRYVRPATTKITGRDSVRPVPLLRRLIRQLSYLVTPFATSVAIAAGSGPTKSPNESGMKERACFRSLFGGQRQV